MMSGLQEAIVRVGLAEAPKVYRARDYRFPSEDAKLNYRHYGLNPRKCYADWTKTCTECGEFPVVAQTGMCGPCTFDDKKTANGEW